MAILASSAKKFGVIRIADGPAEGGYVGFIERIVLGGGVMDAGPLILNPIIQEVKRRAFQPCFEATQIVIATLGLDAAPIGVALLARDAEIS